MILVLLYPFHVKPVLDALRIRKIAKNTQTDTTLAKWKDLILHSKTYIPKNFPELQTFKIFFPKLLCLAMEPCLNITK